MPELPEVETIKNSLLPLLQEKIITRAQLINSHCLVQNSLKFPQDLLGEPILDIKRRGKLLYFLLSKKKILAFHLKMTGKIFVAHSKEAPGKHVHFILTCEDKKVFFEDVRKFGRIYLFTQEEFFNWSFIKNLGPEPFEITEEKFITLFQSSARVKSLLLNQRVIAGIGNIYADEALFAAKIHPQSIARAIPPDILKKLHQSLLQVLKKAIQAGGSSFRDYVNGLGQKGNFQKEFQVYGQKEKPCPKCKNTLTTLKVAGRTSTFCIKCQKKYE